MQPPPSVETPPFFFSLFIEGNGEGKSSTLFFEKLCCNRVGIKKKKKKGGRIGRYIFFLEKRDVIARHLIDLNGPVDLSHEPVGRCVCLLFFDKLLE